VQAWASVSHGLWYARSPEVVHSGLMEALVWLRVPGDIVFSAGAVLLAVYGLRLLRRPPARAVPAGAGARA
jgi:nitric oxide reductase subunit B